MDTDEKKNIRLQFYFASCGPFKKRTHNANSNQGCNGMKFSWYDNCLRKYQGFTVYGITQLLLFLSVLLSLILSATMTPKGMKTEVFEQNIIINFMKYYVLRDMKPFF